jgi:bifunctional aspartokinase / homoserine dehydrogenase 1
MKVLKFGGSSVGSPDRIRGVKRIIESQAQPCVVVVSAFRGITDQLHQISELASERKEEYKSVLTEIRDRHLEAARYLVKEVQRDSVIAGIESMFADISETLHGVFLLHELSKRTLDFILSFGERLSSYIICNTIDDCVYADTRYLIKTDEQFGNALVNFELTNILIKKELAGLTKVAIAPGFIGSTYQNETTTLGRGGSDYTASIIAAALDAEILEIWTDVDGFMTADPKKVEKAYAIESLTYSEAIELSHFGAKVIYTPTLRPVFHKDIPLLVKNTFNPDARGTIISKKSSDANRSPIKGISSIDHIDLVTLQGTGMVGVSGTSMRLFAALAKHSINVILITQASSEYSICFAVVPADSKVAERAIFQEFQREIELSEELRVTVEKDLSIIAIVGEKMKNTPGISATLFRSLGRNGINVIATAQGSSELNISVVIKNSSLRKALNVIHEGFFLSRYLELNLFVAGTGLVGKSLLRQIHKQYDKLLTDHRLKINLIGIANSRKMLIDKKCLRLENCLDSLGSLGEKTDIHEFVNQMGRLNLRNAIFVDCTASKDVADVYEQALTSYVSIVTANKIACSSDYSHYRLLKTTAFEKGLRFMFETNVGAGLPIINTINDLIKSGDRILKIEAVLSGTLNFIFNEISTEVSMSEAIRRAKEKGFSEPDPRIDLSGADVVRKILILSREAGYTLESEDVSVFKFLPDDCFEGTLDEFWIKVKKYDSEFEIKRKELEKLHKKWRFFATLDEGKAKVELLTVDAEHPAFNLAGSNNIILLTTERYRELPMVIKGYGAGAEVTAAGIFADIIRVANV